MGKYKVAHFAAKSEVDHVFTDLGVPTTFLLTSFYWENLIYFGAGPKKGPDGKLAITLPMGGKKLPGMASEDIGRCAYGIFKRGREFTGKTVGIAGEHLTGTQMAAALSNALGQEVRYNEVPPEAYRSFGFPGAEDMGNMFQSHWYNRWGGPFPHFDSRRIVGIFMFGNRSAYMNFNVNLLTSFPQRALITGITAQDGSYLAEFVLAKGYKVNAIVRRWLWKIRRTVCGVSNSSSTTSGSMRAPWRVFQDSTGLP
jgi:hypothetical protein